jgi:hypothetical protein
MRGRALKVALFALLAPAVFGGGAGCGVSRPAPPPGRASRPIPKTWDDAKMAGFELPLADASVKVTHATAEQYYRIPERKLLKSYPIYAPGKEPPGYMEWLKEQEPEPAFDATKLETDDDWVKAGEVVFDAPITSNELSYVSDVRNPGWYEKNRVPVAADGTMPFLRYVVRKKGEVEVGSFSCAMCHTRVMPDGTAVKGAQGNFPFDRVFAADLKARSSVETVRLLTRQLFAAPWLRDDPHARFEQMSLDDFVAAYEAIPPGVMTRFSSSLLYPPQVPDLIGVKDRRYLDHTGLVRQRTIEDLMRYIAVVQGEDLLVHFGDFTPLGNPPPPPEALVRYSDEQLYAAALYLYALRPPPNPNPYDALAARGERVFKREGCATCHAPPLYTNNGLTPVDGFKVPEEQRQLDNIVDYSVGTDPNLALFTRRGTGYYKVASLRGVWYRGPFEHNGSVATLEDWFDPRRTGDNYVPTGFRGAGVEKRAVKGHDFGLKLSKAERGALIAFLKTL